MLDFIPVASVHLCSLAVILWHLSLAVMQTACLLLPQAVKTSLKHYALELYESLQLMFLMAQPSYECMTFIVDFYAHGSCHPSCSNATTSTVFD